MLFRVFKQELRKSLFKHSFILNSITPAFIYSFGSLIFKSCFIFCTCAFHRTFSHACCPPCSSCRAFNPFQSTRQSTAYNFLGWSARGGFYSICHRRCRFAELSRRCHFFHRFLRRLTVVTVSGSIPANGF